MHVDVPLLRPNSFVVTRPYHGVAIIHRTDLDEESLERKAVAKFNHALLKAHPNLDEHLFRHRAYMYERNAVAYLSDRPNIYKTIFTIVVDFPDDDQAMLFMLKTNAPCVKTVKVMAESRHVKAL